MSITILCIIAMMLALISAAFFISVGFEDMGAVSMVAYILSAISVTVAVVSLIVYAANRISEMIASWW